ncbi:hypothetical protein JIN85_17860 [Luteolibacter pohnpeiensis]|uniref:histidine kinase n=1 Tax=Luteolibacter pohnpeiensis TaxID=454153 RepID=A0A934S736_9BACT|nr:ATP-binding protein [Luteolibacter pohnpeiensis]MBK1884290.1 hypothetical protein [Luteolibacter pohnpeiensis]
MTHPVSLIRLILSMLLGFLAWPACSYAENELLNLAELKHRINVTGPERFSFQISGTVCTTQGSFVILKDDSDSLVLRLPDPQQLGVGDQITVIGNHCPVRRGRVAIEIGTDPVVENDGRHSADEKSGSVYLTEGMQPLRMEWFNGAAQGALGLKVSGPDLTKKTVGGDLVWHLGSDGKYQSGLTYESYLGSWYQLPDFSKLTPQTTGVTDGFDLSKQPAPWDVAMVFTGYFKAPATGVYQFDLLSDDGARFSVGKAEDVCRWIVQKAQGIGSNIDAAGALENFEGKVGFMDTAQGRLEIELDGGRSMPVLIADASELVGRNWMGKKIRASGLLEEVRGINEERSSRLLILGSDSIQILPVSQNQEEPLLTSVGQIRKLAPEESRQSLKARVRGVITMATTNSVVLQDGSGGVFIHISSANGLDQPKPGQFWEIEGTTNPGSFSPVIMASDGHNLGTCELPTPVRPTWEQLMNGSLDAEQVEIQGVVISAESEVMSLLTPDGKIEIFNMDAYPLPYRKSQNLTGDALLGCLVRLRGVFTARWNYQTGQVIPGKIMLGNVSLSVDETPPIDPFALPPMKTTDLLRFTSHASALRRVKVTGQLLHLRQRECFLTDAGKGFRVLLSKEMALQAGDRVEVVGYPRLDGPSPVLVEAVARKLDHTDFPEAAIIDRETLPDRSLDSSLVSLTADLVNETYSQNQRVFELKTGAERFLAKLDGDRPTNILRPGSKVRVAGVYVSLMNDSSQNNFGSFELLLNRSTDMQVLQPGPWWTGRHTITAVGILSGGLFLALAWVVALRKQVNLRTLQLAAEIEERQRTEQNEIMERERSRVARDLHDELGSGLTEAGILSALMRNPAIPHEKKDTYLDQLGAVCRNLVTGLDEIVWAVNPKYDSVDNLASYYSLFAQRFLKIANIACRLSISGGMPNLPLDSGRRHGVFLAFKEALNNVVKHSGATSVELAIGVVEGKLIIAIADDGEGFEISAASRDGHGLHGMVERLEHLGGDCRISSVLHSGTKVEMILPLERGEI